MKNNIIIAITGGIGSGKSTALKIFEKYNFMIINGDLLFHEILKKGNIYYLDYAKELDSWLGTKFQDENEISRIKMREILDNTPNGYNLIQNIAKKYVVYQINEIINKNIDKNIVFEFPLLIEYNIENLFQHTLLIVSDLEIRINRIKKRNPLLTNKNIENIINSQYSDDKKMKIIKNVINNNNSIDELEIKIIKYINKNELSIKS